MAALGIVFLGLLAVAVVIALVILAFSLPDIARYRRIRHM